MLVILGVKIDDKNEDEFLRNIEERFLDGIRTFIVTPNPEMLVLANGDADFKNVLNSADIKIPDGAGLRLGAKILGRNLKNRVTGTDLMGRLCELANQDGLTAYLLGGEMASVRKTSENLKQKYPALKIVGAESGGKGEEWDNRVIIEHINAVKPDMLFVALGHGRQEKWIFENLSSLPSVKLAMGVGGAFDFISGKIRRAPFWMRRAGLEWFWRLVFQPQRIGRIFNATAVFLWLCIKNKK